MVRKRLDAEGLTDRLFMIVDLAKDREAIIRALREQLVEVRTQPDAQAVRRERQEVLASVEALEGEIDQHHMALHETDAVSGYSYREVLGLLVQTRAEGKLLDLPALRTLLGSLESRSFAAVAEACAPLASLWLAASYESSVLHALKSFPADDALVGEISLQIGKYLAAEQRRQQVLRDHAGAFDTDDPGPLMAWLEANRSFFSLMGADERARLASWLPLFKDGAGAASSGEGTIGTLNACLRDIEALDRSAHDDILFGAVVGLPGALLRQHLVDTRVVAQPPTFWSRLRPSRWGMIRRTRRFLEEIGQPTDVGRMTQLQNALALEERLRPIRDRVGQIRKLLGIEPLAPPPPVEILIRETRAVLRQLEAVFAALKAVVACPRAADAERMALTGTVSAFVELAKQFEGAQARHLARQASLGAIGPLATWFPQEWLSAQARVIGSPGPTWSRWASCSKHCRRWRRFRGFACGLAPCHRWCFRPLLRYMP